MKKNLFRESALQKLSSPEQLDKAITIIPLFGWIVLVALGILFFVIFIWSLKGSIPEKVKGAGILINAEGLQAITYTSGGVVKDVFVENGDEVLKGQTIARIERQDLLEQIQVTTQKLENLQENYDKASLASKKNDATSERIRLKSEQDLRSQIASMDSLVADAEKKERNAKDLYISGIIAEIEYMKTRNELFSLQRQKQDLERQLLNIGLENDKNKINTDKQNTSLEQQISETKKQLEILQENYQKATIITSTDHGIVYEVSIARGSYVSPGSTVVLLEPISRAGTTLLASVFFPATDGKKIKTGMNIEISPNSIKQEEYGFIRGIVIDVSTYPVSPQYLQSTFKNSTIAQNFAKMENPIEVKVRLIPDTSTKTGYKWSSSKGPATELETGELCSASVVVKDQKPIQLVIPKIKKKLFGLGE